ILPQRELLRQRYLSALLTLAEAESQAGHWEQALVYALRLAEADPLAERGHRLVMQCYVHLGQPHRALAQYDLLCLQLQQELDASPTPATQQLAERIRQEARSHTPKATAPFLDAPDALPLVGRDAERARLVDAVEWAIAGRGGVVLVEGEAGMGKSKLLDAVADDAAWRGAWVFRAVAAEVEEQAWGLLVQAMSPLLTPLHIQQLSLVLEPVWLGVLAQLFPAIAHIVDVPKPPALDPAEDQQRIQEALLRLLHAAGKLAPLVLLLDDLHRADRETLDALPVLARSLDRSPVLLVAAYRAEVKRTDSTRWEVLRAVDQAGVHRRIVLQPLDVQATTTLVQMALGMKRSAPRFSARIHASTGGVPLFVLESLRTLHENGLLFRTDEGEWATPWDSQTEDYDELVLPERVEALLEQRIQALSPVGRALLEPAAVLGVEFPLPVLQAMAPLDGPTFLQGVRELVARHLFVETETHLRFRHDLIREVVYQNMPMTKARTLHRRAGETLLEHDHTAPATLAHHFTLAEDWARALEFHRQAAQEALARSSYRSARHHLEAALEALERCTASGAALPEDPQVELLLQYEHVLDVLGAREPQAAVLDQLARWTTEATCRSIQILCRRAAFLTLSSRYDESQAMGRQALELARSQHDVYGMARALITLARNEDQRGAPAAAIPLLEEAETLGVRDPGLQAQVYLVLANALAGVKQYTRARGAASAALDRYRQLGDRRRQVDVLNVLGIVAMEEGLYAQAEAYHRQGIELSREIGYLFGEVRAQVNLANVHNRTGELGRCIQLYQEVLERCPVLNVDRIEAVTRVNLASTLTAFVGDTTQARELLRWVIEYAQRVEDPATLGHALAILAAADLTDEAWDAARQHLDQARAALEESGELYVLAQLQRTRALFYALRGEGNQALKELEHGVALCQEHGMVGLESWSLAMMGWIHALEGRADEAVSLTQAAMDSLGDLEEMDYMMWYYRYVALDVAGHRAEADQALARSVEKLEAMLATLSPAHQAMSRERVPEHREILAARRRHDEAKR
ncbi:MAG: hypothetical protein D6790_15570, partial [Caldilineae bacterium]